MNVLFEARIKGEPWPSDKRFVPQITTEWSRGTRRTHGIRESGDKTLCGAWWVPDELTAHHHSEREQRWRGHQNIRIEYRPRLTNAPITCGRCLDKALSRRIS